MTEKLLNIAIKTEQFIPRTKEEGSKWDKAATLKAVSELYGNPNLSKVLWKDTFQKISPKDWDLFYVAREDIENSPNLSPELVDCGVFHFHYLVALAVSEKAKLSSEQIAFLISRPDIDRQSKKEIELNQIVFGMKEEVAGARELLEDVKKLPLT